MSAGGAGDDKPYVDPERPDPEAGRRPPGHAEGGGRPPSEASDRLPPAGPHDDPALINPDATPGTGALQPPGGHDDVDSTSG